MAVQRHRSDCSVHKQTDRTQRLTNTRQFEAGRKLGPWLVDGREAYVRRLLHSVLFIYGLGLLTIWESIQSVQYSDKATWRTSEESWFHSRGE